MNMPNFKPSPHKGGKEILHLQVASSSIPSTTRVLAPESMNTGVVGRRIHDLPGTVLNKLPYFAASPFLNEANLPYVDHISASGYPYNSDIALCCTVKRAMPGMPGF
jgi:hypothetical protein